MPAKIRHIAPLFLVSDVVRSAEYYRDALGFAFEQYWGEPPAFCMVNRDDNTIMLSQHSHSDGPGDTNPNGAATGHGDDWDAYIWVDDANAMAEELKASGANIVKEPYDTFYEMREFVVSDPDGYHICFGSGN